MEIGVTAFGKTVTITTKRTNVTHAVVALTHEDDLAVYLHTRLELAEKKVDRMHIAAARYNRADGTPGKPWKDYVIAAVNYDGSLEQL